MVIETIKDKLERCSVINIVTGCFEWTGVLTYNGYGRCGVKGESGKWGMKRVHRLAYEEYIGEIPDGLCVCHHCDNPKCINPHHLFIGTAQDNIDDKERKGRGGQLCGEEQYNARLTEKDVVQIRQLQEQGFSLVAISKRFPVHSVTIGKIVRRTTWKHV